MSDTFITVARFPNTFLAHAAKNRLAEIGIRSFLSGEHCLNEGWANMGEVQLQIAAVDAERALALLAELNDDAA